MTRKEDLAVVYQTLEGDAHILLNKALAHSIGANEAIIFSELLSRRKYFARRGLLKDGFFFNTITDLEAGTSLSAYQQRLAVANLQKKGLITVKVKGAPPKRYFKIENKPELLNQLLKLGDERMDLLLKKIPQSVELDLESLSDEDRQIYYHRVRMVQAMEMSE